MKLYSVRGQIYRQYTACKPTVRLQRTREHRRQSHHTVVLWITVYSYYNQQNDHYWDDYQRFMYVSLYLYVYCVCMCTERVVLVSCEHGGVDLMGLKPSP